LRLTLYALRLTPYALRLTLYALRLTPYALRLTPYALRLMPYALRLTPYALRLTLYALRLTPYALRLTLYALRLKPSFYPQNLIRIINQVHIEIVLSRNSFHRALDMRSIQQNFFKLFFPCLP
jgi:hypothetical protein